MVLEFSGPDAVGAYPEAAWSMVETMSALTHPAAAYLIKGGRKWTQAEGESGRPGLACLLRN